jgi:hypothetical protein
MEEAARRVSGEKPELAVQLIAGETVLPELERFRLVGPRMEVVLLVLPLALLAFLLLDWLAGWNTFATDAMRLPALVVLAAVLLILRALFLTTPRAFRSLWLQGVLRSAQDDQPVEVALVDFLDQFRKLLHSRWAWLVGALFVLGSYFVTYSGLVLLGLAESGNSPAELFMIFFVYRLGFIVVPPVFLLGMLFWRVGVVALFVILLVRRFSLDVMPNHPDGSGGLKPLGDICLLVACALLAPALFSLWPFAATYFNIPHKDFYLNVWSQFFSQLIVVVSALGLLIFILPLYLIHQEMARRASELQVELDRISRTMGQLLDELRVQADQLDTAEGRKKAEKLEFLEEVYRKNSHIPTWPLNWGIIRRFAAAEAVPLLSLLGTSEQFQALVDPLVSFFQN